MEETKERLSMIAEIIYFKEKANYFQNENTLLKLIIRGVNNENTENNY